MAHQPVGDSQTIFSFATSNKCFNFTVQSDTLRVVPKNAVHV